MSVHTFDTAVALQAPVEGSFLGHASAAYANMGGPAQQPLAPTLVALGCRE